jgi:hypothetical protein
MLVLVMMMLQVLNQRKPSLKDKENQVDLKMKWMVWEAQVRTMEKMKTVKRVMILLSYQVKLK